MKAHDERENCYLSLNNSSTRKVFQLPNKHFLTHKMLPSPENEITRRNARTVKKKNHSLLLFTISRALFYLNLGRRKKSVKRQLASKQGEKIFKYDIQS